jgi:hypothetical protein
MTNLDKALADITAIRTQMARGAEFRGYGPATVAATGCVALIAAAVQARFLPDPSANVLAYLALWIATAAACVVLIGIEMVGRSRRIHSGLADEMIWAATGQLIPAGVAGALLTIVLFRVAPQTLWIVPGLWQIVFSLGPLAAAPDVCGRDLVSGGRARESRDRRARGGALALDHGHSVRGRPVPDGRRALFQPRERCRNLAPEAERAVASPTTVSTA